MTTPSSGVSALNESQGPATGVAAVTAGSPSRRTLQIGALCDPISKQLADLISAQDGKILDRDNDSINQLYIRGYIGDSVTAKARKRLLSKCQEAVRRYAEANIAGLPRAGNAATPTLSNQSNP